VYADDGNLFAANRSFDSIGPMFDADIADSKLCACATRHATGHRPSDGAVAQPGKGQGFAPPRCIPSQVPQAAAETVPVSAPFGFARVVVSRSWEARP